MVLPARNFHSREFARVVLGEWKIFMNGARRFHSDH
jgi:hypothetical protein